MPHFSEPIFTEANKTKIEAVLYQAMFDETIRLRKCHSRLERREIREFLISAYRVCMERNLENKDPDIFQDNMQQLHQ